MIKNYKILKKSYNVISSWPLISIVIPVYNREDLVLETIQSALDQTYPNFEIIVIDNASEDNTLNKVLNIFGNEEKLMIIKNDKNIGPVKNWIKGIELASGEYIKILFSDDLLLPNCLSLFYKSFKDDIGFVCSSYFVGKNLENSKKFSRLFLKNGKNNSFFFLSRFLLTRRFIYSPCAGLFRKTDIKNSLQTSVNKQISLECINTGAGPDVQIFLDLLTLYPYFFFFRTPQVFFRDHNGSFSTGNRKAEVIKGYEETFSAFAKNSNFFFRILNNLNYLFKKFFS